jgi:hypothetical protein
MHFSEVFQLTFCLDSNLLPRTGQVLGEASWCTFFIDSGVELIELFSFLSGLPGRHDIKRRLIP